jgi:hypothetical protein
MGRKQRKKRRNELLKKINTINQLRLTKPNMNSWNMKDCRDFVQYKKKKGDPKMPSAIPLMRQRCINVQGRTSPDCSVHGLNSKDDDEEGDAAASAENDFVVDEIVEL